MQGELNERGVTLALTMARYFKRRLPIGGQERCGGTLTDDQGGLFGLKTSSY